MTRTTAGAPTTAQGTDGGDDTSGTRRVFVWILVVVAVVAVLAIAAPDLPAPYATTSEAGDGTDILRRILVDLAVEVEEGPAEDRLDALGPRDVAVVFRDQLDAGQERRLAAHVMAGGRVVVAAPGSGPAGDQDVLAGVGVVGPPGCDALPARTVLAADVDAFAGRGVTAVPDLVTLDVAPTVACWEDDGAALVAIYDGVPGADPGTPAGTTVVLGDPDVVTNAAIIADPDLAQLAALFLPEPGGRVQVLVGTRPPPASSEPVGAVPANLRRGMWLVGLALAVYALGRGRRLGRVVGEPPLVEVPASALAGGIAELLERHGQAVDAAARLREGLRADVAPRLGAGTGEPTELAALVARATNLPRGQVDLALLDIPVTGVSDLMDITRAGREIRAGLSTQLAAAPVDAAHRDDGPAP